MDSSFRQRGPEEQDQTTRATPAERNKRWFLMLALVIVAGLLAYQMGVRAKRHVLPRSCAIAYTQARTAADTAIVDAQGVSERTFMPRNCGAARRVVERARDSVARQEGSD
jgi:hypothetical protein